MDARCVADPAGIQEWHAIVCAGRRVLPDGQDPASIAACRQAGLPAALDSPETAGVC